MQLGQNLSHGLYAARATHVFDSENHPSIFDVALLFCTEATRLNGLAEFIKLNVALYYGKFAAEIYCCCGDPGNGEDGPFG